MTPTDQLARECAEKIASEYHHKDAAEKTEIYTPLILAALTAALDGARRDGERLNWLFDNSHNYSIKGDDDFPMTLLVRWNLGGDKSKLRQAIDAEINSPRT